MAGALLSPISSMTIGLLAGLLALTASASAQDAAAPPLAPSKTWSLSFEPSIWAPGIDGDIQLPGGAGSPDFERFDVDGPHPTGMGFLRFRKNKLLIEASGFNFSFGRNATADSAISVGGLSFTPGQTGIIDITLASVQVIAGKRVIEYILTPVEAPEAVSFNVDVYGGIRSYSFKTTIATGASSVSDSGFWVEPIVGVRGSIDIFNKVTLHLSFDGGAQPLGDHTSSSFDIIVGVQWRPTTHVGIQFGWRQLIVNLENGGGANKLEFSDGTLAGIYGSLVLRF